MGNSKTRQGWASVAGLVLAGAALGGCTSGGQASAGQGADTASATASTATDTAAGTTATTATATTATSSAAQPTADANANTYAGVSACTGTELKVTTVSAGAGLGHVGWILVFTNTGSAPCSVEGYPGAGVTDRPGDVVLNATRQQTGYLGGQYPRPAALVLKPGGTASTVLEWLDSPPNGETPVGANCPGMDGGKVLITAPNTRQSTPFPAPGNLCTGFEVHPLVAGTAGRPA